MHTEINQTKIRPNSFFYYKREVVMSEFIISDFIVPKVSTRIGTTLFSPWNMLPSSVKSIEKIAKFHQCIETYHYDLAYPS